MREELQDLLESLEIRDIVGGVAVLDGPQKRKPVPIHGQSDGDLLEVGTVVLGMAVGGLDRTTAQRRRGECRGPREEAVERIVVLGTLDAVGPIENPSGGVEVHEGKLHRLLDAEIQGHLPEDAGGADLIEGVEASTQTVVVEVVGVNAFPEEQFGVELLKGVVEFVKRPPLFAEEVDDQGHDPFAGGKD